MRPLVKSPVLGFVGLLAVGLVALKMLRGDLTLVEGAIRVTVALIAIIVVERLVIPIAGLLIGDPVAPPPPPPPPAPPVAAPDPAELQAPDGP